MFIKSIKFLKSNNHITLYTANIVTSKTALNVESSIKSWNCYWL